MERRILAYGLACCLAAQAQIYKDIVVLPGGSLTWRNSGDMTGFTLTVPGGLASDLSYSLPATAGSTGDCLKITGTGALGFGACGASSGWSLTGTELSPVETDADLRLIRATNGQGIGSWAKPWSGVFSTSFQAPNAAGTDAKVTLNGTSLSGADTGGTTKVTITFNSGSIATSGTITSTGAAGADYDAWYALKSGSLGSSNWRWALSHRADGKQLWFYAYDGTNFSIPLKMNPSGNSVCVNCTGDATAGYSLDVGGQALVTGLRAGGAGGYVNAAQIEHRDNASGLHFGWNANIANIVGIPGAARYVTLQDASSNPIIRMYSHVVGPAEPRVQVYGDLRADADSTRKLGMSGTRWSEGHVQSLYVDNIEPRPGSAGQINWGADLFPSIGTMRIGHSGNRVNEVWVTNLNVSGSCTGCGSGGWTTSGSSIYPSSNTATLEVLQNPTASPQSQALGSATAPWSFVATKSLSVPHTSGGGFYRVNLTTGGITLANTSGVDTTYLFSVAGSMQNIGGYFVYNALSDFAPVVSLTKTVLKHTAYAGSGNASLCVDSTGQMYRGTPGC